MVPATNLTELSTAFTQIAKGVGSCDFVLDQAPPNTDELYVFFDGNPQPIARDDQNGWSFDPTTRRFTFNGSVCDEVKSGSVTDVQVVFGCPYPVIQ